VNHMVALITMIAIFSASFTKLIWGVATLYAGYRRFPRKQPIHHFIRSWEFYLGGVLVSSAAVFFFWGYLLYEALEAGFIAPITVRGWVFVLLSLNLAIWCAAALILWLGKRFDPPEGL
jgi:hypothetical protein